MATLDRDLRAALLAARTTSEILAAVARVEYRRTHRDEDAPDHAIPSEADLYDWPDVRNLPPGDGPKDPVTWLTEAESRLVDVLGGEGWQWMALPALPALLQGAKNAPPASFSAVRAAKGSVTAHHVESVHARWLAIPEADRPRHPLAPVVKAWQGRARDIEPERRETAILPESFRVARIAAHVDGQDPQLPLTLTGGEVGEVGEVAAAPVQRPLFEFEVPETSLVPVLPLRMYRNAGGLDRTRGRGAPIAKRIWWGAIANSPIKYRERDGSIRLRTTLRDLNDWLYPGQRWHPKKLDALRRGLWEADAIRVDWERREWRIVGVEALPNETTKLDDPLPIRVAMPEGSDRGALIVLAMLYRCGTVSGPVFDAAIRLAYLWDAANRHNGGRRIYATRPRVLRDERCRLTDVAGKLLTGPDPALPWKDRRKIPADRPAVSWNDSRAVHVGIERNPAANKVPELDRRDLLRLFYGDEAPVDGVPAREALKQTRRMLRDHFEEPRFAVLEERFRGREFEAVRILQSRPSGGG